jgi:hypothetical protein
MENIDAATYAQEVQDLARQIRDEAREYRRDVEDVIHETIDSHGWVIYTYKAIQVMQHTDHDDAIEEYGEISMEGGWSGLVSRAAYAALAADVRDAIAELEEEEEEEEPADAE